MSKPTVLMGEQQVELRPLEYGNESELQELLAARPELLPIAEVAHRFAGAKTIGRELATSAGPIDLLLMNDEGRVTLVETRLARNPEQKRDVVAQCLDYLLEMPTSYEAYEKLYRAYRKDDGASLFRDLGPGQDESEDDFRETVESNLRRREVLVAIVGDHVKHVDQLARMLDALVPSAVGAEAAFCVIGLRQYAFRVDPVEGRIYVPRVYLKTMVVERKVLRVEVMDAAGRELPFAVRSLEGGEAAPPPGAAPAARPALSAKGLKSQLRSAGLGSIWDSFLAVVGAHGYELAYRASAVVVQLPLGDLRVPVVYVRPDGSTVLSDNARKVLEKMLDVSLAPLRTLQQRFQAEFPDAEVRFPGQLDTSYVVSGPSLRGHEAALLGALADFSAAMREEAE